MNHIETMSVTLTKAARLMQIYLDAQLVPMLQSSPGIGKSAIVKAYAEYANLKLIDVRLSTFDPTALNGFPMHQRDAQGEFTGKADFLPMATFPLEGDIVPDGYAGYLLFFDEFNQANRAVQAAAYRVILDREIGDKKLHKDCHVVAAGNLMTDNAIANPLGTALQSRLTHVFIREDLDEFMQYAIDNNFDERVMAWVKSRGNVMDFDPHHSDCTFVCPRTLEMLNKAVQHIPTDQMYELQQVPMGIVGAGNGTDFVSFVEVYKDLVTIEQITANPKQAKLPSSSNARWATVFMLSGQMKKGKKSNKAVLEYMDRMDGEFAALFFQDCIRRDTTIIQDIAFDDMVCKWERQGKI